MKRVSARGLVVTDKGLAVIFRRKINEQGTKEYYVVPGGGINEGEDIIEGLKRELEEELDIEVEVNDLAFKVETDERIEYFYNCKYISGDFKLNGEELDRMSESNYYEPTFIKLDEINKYDIMENVKEYFKNK
jgi:ADP-ribose pyrophosphatase YjhB (NUDIX family)